MTAMTKNLNSSSVIKMNDFLNNSFYGKLMEEMANIQRMKKTWAKKKKALHEELVTVAWHPDRVYDWCFDGEEKSFLEEKTKKWC